jgi:hypothetical protein
MNSLLRSSRSLPVVILCGLFFLCTGRAFGDIFTVDNSDDQFTLYTDPNTGREVKLAGLSGLAAAPGQQGFLWAVTDRGPRVDSPVGAAAVIPDYAPRILLLQLEQGGTARIVREIPLRRPGGGFLTGLANPCMPSDAVVDLSSNPVSPDPDGIDPEGIATGPGGTFWICDEYSPSVALVLPNGSVALRLVPQGTLCGGEVVPTFDILPAVLAKRRANRGLEGIATTPQGTIYAVMQRPLSNPNTAAGDNSRNIRLLALEPSKMLMGLPGGIRQLLYLCDPVPAVTPAPYRLRDIYASDLEAVSENVLLVTERRTDKVFAIQLNGATDITPFEDASGHLISDPTRTIESLSPAELAALGIQPVTKTAVLSGLTTLYPYLDKVEGLTISGGNLVLCNDNDFNLLEAADFSTVPATLQFQDPPNLPTIITVPVPPLPE